MADPNDAAGAALVRFDPMAAVVVAAVLVGAILVWHLVMLGVDARRRRREEAERWARWRGLP